MPKPRRVLGPYVNGDKFRLVILDGTARKSLVLPTLKEAEQTKSEIEKVIDIQTVVPIGHALDEYLADKAQRGAVHHTIYTLDKKLRAFLPVDDGLDLSPAQAQKLYEQEMSRIGRYGRAVTAATHKGTLRAVKTFYRWAIERGYVKENPFASVKPVGKSNTGKAQLRIDEARRLCSVLIEHSERDYGAVAVLMQLMLGLRSSEVLNRQIRDIDDGGRVLWIPSGKTRNARRRLIVPDEIQPLLRRLTEGKDPEHYLFSGENNRPHYNAFIWKRVRKYCELANVPKVCPHSLRGLHSTLALEAGATSTAVAAALGHGSFAVTAKHYADADTLRNTTNRRVSSALHGAQNLPVEALLQGLRALPAEQLETVLRALKGAGT